MNWDAIGGITQIITIVYLVYQFHYLPKKEKKESLFNLKVLFLLSRNKAEKLVNDLTYYYVENNCEHEEFLPNITFSSQVYQLHHLILNELNDETLENVMKISSSNALITSAVQSINNQILSFTQLEAHFNTVYKFKSMD